jgi:hypothetical protein
MFLFFCIHGNKKEQSRPCCHMLFEIKPTYRVSQNSRIPNSERGREGPSGARKILEKKKSLNPEEDISTLILFNT